MAPRLKGYRIPWSIIHFCVYAYNCFSLSYREIEELMFVRGLRVSYLLDASLTFLKRKGPQGLINGILMKCILV